MSGRRSVPEVVSVTSEEAVRFCMEVIDASGVADALEALTNKPTGRRRQYKVRALLVGLLVLAIDDRPLHLKAVTRLLFCTLPESLRQALGVVGKADTRKAFLARYRQVRYLFHLAVEVIDPSVERKNKVVAADVAEKLRLRLSDAETAVRRRRLVEVTNALVEASARVATDEELDGYDGSVGLDATPMPLYSRGPSARAGTSASDPDGGWYVREGDHRQTTGPQGKPLRKLFWALEVHLVTMGRPPGSVPAWPNLVLGLSLGRPGEDPAGHGVQVLSSIRRRKWPAGTLGSDRGYTQTTPESFHLPVRALGYQPVMDYRVDSLGRQAQSEGALLVEGGFYCPAMPEDLVVATRDYRAGTIAQTQWQARIEARRCWHLVRKEGPDADGYERWACPAQGEHPKLCCPLRDPGDAVGRPPVLEPPAQPPKVCTQTAVTIAPDVGARHRQHLEYGSDEWQRTYATYRNTIEGTNGQVKDPAHEALAEPARRRVRGIAAQSLYATILVMALNVRKIRAFRQMTAEGTATSVAERARRRRTSITDYRPPPS